MLDTSFKDPEEFLGRESIDIHPAPPYDYGTDNEILRAIIDLYITGGYEPNEKLPLIDITYNLWVLKSTIKRTVRENPGILEKHKIQIDWNR